MHNTPTSGPLPTPPPSLASTSDQEEDMRDLYPQNDVGSYLQSTPPAFHRSHHASSASSAAISVTSSQHRGPLIPHRGSLRRIPSPENARQHMTDSSGGAINQPLEQTPVLYSIELPHFAPAPSQDPPHGRSTRSSPRRLVFTKSQLDSMQRLFLVLDTDTRGWLDYSQVQEFLDLRCSVVQRRDAARASGGGRFSRGTLDEAWEAIVCSGLSRSELDVAVSQEQAGSVYLNTALGMEGWMILLRFISFCQYHEAKQRFSAKHLGGNSNLVMVEVPTPSFVPLTVELLLEYESKFQPKKHLKKKKGKSRTRHLAHNQTCTYCPPMPELDLNHCCIAAHESVGKPESEKHSRTEMDARVRVDAFGGAFSGGGVSGSATSIWNSSGTVEVLLTFTSSKSPNSHLSRASSSNALNGLMSTVSSSTTTTTTVRRTLADLRWLHDTFLAHKKLGGTLCGRILPPLPLKQDDITPYSKFEDSHCSPENRDAVSQNILSMCKSVWGTIKRNTTKKSNPCVKGVGSRDSRDNMLSTSQEIRLKRLERYLNYLLEHSGLRSSFPLNAVLKSSKTGLEAAKRSLEELKNTNKVSDIGFHAHIASNATDDVVASRGDRLPPHDNASPFGAISSSCKLKKTYLQSSESANVEWIRTAAQAAMALKLHGILDATGMSTYSARLQHASLPPLDYHQSYREDSSQNPAYNAQKRRSSNMATASTSDMSVARSEDEWDYSESPHDGEFESEIKTVECGLDDEYDLLPEPTMVHASLYANDAESTSYAGLTQGLLEDDTLIDPDIDKLRDIIGSVDVTLHKCLAAHRRIAAANEDRFKLHLGIVRGLDTHTYDGYEGGSVLTIDERSFLGGITKMERCGELVQEGNLDFGEALSWQASLATAAVSAAEDVRAAVRAARTAAGAKCAAESAVIRAQKALDKFLQAPPASSNEAEIHAAKTRAGISNSHAIHATVIAHETTAVKRKAAMALAHDVRQWNVHRKREMLRSCLSAALSQKNASRKAADAWRVLREGMDGPMEEKVFEKISSSIGSFSTDEDEGCVEGSASTAAAFDAFPKCEDGEASKAPFGPIVAVDHVSLLQDKAECCPRVDDGMQEEPRALFSSGPNAAGYEEAFSADILSTPAEYCDIAALVGSATFTGDAVDHCCPTGTATECASTGIASSDIAGDTEGTDMGSSVHAPNTLDTNGVGIGPATDAAESEICPSIDEVVSGPYTTSFESTSRDVTPPADASAENSLVENESTLAAKASAGHMPANAEETERTSSSLLTSANRESSDKSSAEKENVADQAHGESTLIYHGSRPRDETDLMTASMQSLVDGLMAWGGRYDPQDDVSLPSGMAVSIAEETGIFGSPPEFQTPFVADQ